MDQNSVKILLLCEPRSGSTNLANWFFAHGFDTRWETSGPNSQWYLKDGLHSIKLKPNKHLVLKEIFYPSGFSYETYIKYCDKVIFLFRENTKQQEFSYDHALRFNSWESNYLVDEHYTPDQNNIKYLNDLKVKFKEFRSKHSEGTLTVSYEDLYSKGKITEVKEFLGLEDLLTREFPVGHKLGYKVNNSNKKEIL